jgi:hypothetical protein
VYENAQLMVVACAAAVMSRTAAPRANLFICMFIPSSLALENEFSIAELQHSRPAWIDEKNQTFIIQRSAAKEGTPRRLRKGLRRGAAGLCKTCDAAGRAKKRSIRYLPSTENAINKLFGPELPE